MVVGLASPPAAGAGAGLPPSTSTAQPAATSAAAIAAKNAAGIQATAPFRWTPACPLDLLEPPAMLLNELLERFQRPEQRERLTTETARRGAPAAPVLGSAAASMSAAMSGIAGSPSRSAPTAAAAGGGPATGPGPAARLADALQALYDRDVAAPPGGGSGAAPAGGSTTGSAARRRRFREALQSLEQQLRQGQTRRMILDDAEAAQRRAVEAAAEAGGRGDRAAAVRLSNPSYLPGELRPGGPRHDNDKAHFVDIQVVPTRGELLCTDTPYLPSNRPGAMPHLSAEPHRARLEVNFRLLRHDVVAPLASALCALRRAGGLTALQRQQAERQRRRQSALHRLKLDGGARLFVFRDVRFDGLEVTKCDGVVIKVTFEQPPAAATAGNRRAIAKWWEKSKCLSHGTLLCFWWEPQAAASAAAAAASAAGRTARGTAGGQPPPQQAAPEPQLVVGVVAQRDPKELAGGERNDARPLIGIRLISAHDYQALLGVWLEAAGGCGREVVLVQEHNSFFAYEPVLRALQRMSVIPLAGHIVPGCEEPRPAPPPRRLPLLLGPAAPDAAPDAAPSIELPAYLADQPVVDLRYLADKERVMRLPQQERTRVLRVLSAVDLSRPVSQFPTPELLAATTLDGAQAGALRAVLSQEVAVVQGPPGTGKTFLGVVLTRALLCNTRNTQATGGWRSRNAQTDARLPDWIAARIGPEAAERPPALAAAPRPDIGPVLVVCFTNHALDSFLEGLLDAGVTKSIVRVGGNSKSERLEPYNLKNLQERIGGRLRGVHRRAEEIAKRAERLSLLLRDLANGETSRPLSWEELGPLLRERHPNLYDSFARGMRRWNRTPQHEEEAAGADGLIATDDDGFQTVLPGRRGKGRHRELVSEDWLRGSPEKDWRHGRLERQATATTARQSGGLIQSDDEMENAGEGEEEFWSDEEPEQTGTPEATASHTSAAAPFAGNSQSPAGFPQGIPGAQGQPPGAMWGGVGGQSAGAAMPILPAVWQGAYGPVQPLFAGAGAGAVGPLTPAQMAGFAAMQRMAAQHAAMAAMPGQAAAAAQTAALAAQMQQMNIAGNAQRMEQNGALAGDAVSSEALRMVQPPPPPRPQQQVQRSSGARSQRGGGAGTAAGAAAAASAPAEVAAMGVRQRPLDELLASDDVWSMSRHERQLLHARLQRLRYLDLLAAAREVQTQYDAVQQELQAEYDQASLAVLQGARVVGMTTSGVARQQRILASLKPRVLLVEEAAEVYEAHVLVCLSRSVEHLVLIGDHEQLRPKPNEYELQAESGRGLDLDVSLFERLVRQRGFPVATLEEQRRMRPQISRLIRETIYPDLRDHPRVATYPPLRGLSHSLFFLDHCHPEGGGGAGGDDRSKYNEWEAEYVVALARHMLLQGYAPEDVVILVTYAGQLFRVREALGRANLRVVISERDQEELRAARDGVADDGDDEDDGASDGGSTPQQGPGPATVGVLPPGASPAVEAAAAAAARPGGTPGPERSRDAAERMRRPAGAMRGGAAASSSSGAAAALPAGSRVVSMKEGIRVATVDNYQGEEATVILLSTVRNSPEGHIGFLKMRNRVNVMLSRARHGMVVLGHAPSLRAGAAKFRVHMWGQVLDLMEAEGCVGSCIKVKCGKHGHETEIREPGDFQRLAGDGGCQLPCGEAMPCGHTCPRRCHADDPKHTLGVCTKPCNRLLQPCGHACTRTCGEECGECTRPVDEPYVLECGHAGPLGIPCWRRHKPGAIRCKEPVEVTLPACGHTLTVSCCEAEDARAGRRPCSQEVQVTMPACGHCVTVACGERAALLADPTRCTATCGAALAECGHACGGKCGSCVRRVLHGAFQELVQGFLETRPANLRDAWRRYNAPPDAAAAPAGAGAAVNVDGWLRFLSRDGPGEAHGPAFLTFLAERLAAPPGARAGPFSRHHAHCKERCGKTLVCGHECGATCHDRGPCRPCNKRCWIACAHHTCNKPCGEPCVLCAEPCVWRCEHRGACGAPCGAPCDRLPCDERCSRKLGCGHRCPGLCGEECPPARFCVHPNCMARAKDNVRNQCVDQVMLRTFSELTPEDVDSDPLVVLPCGHAYLTSTLDGLLELEKFYEREGGSGRWLHPLPLGNRQPARACPTCRQPIHGVRRYGRPINQASLELVQRKHMHTWGQALAAAEAKLKQLSSMLAADGSNDGEGAAARPAAGRGGTGLERQLRAAAAEQAAGRAPPDAALAPVFAAQESVAGAVRTFMDVCDAYVSPPKQRVYEAALAMLQRAEEAEAALRASANGAGGGAAGGLPPSGDPELRAARLAVARTDLASLQPDTTQLCRAWVGVLGCLQVHVAAAAAGIRQAGRLLPQDTFARRRAPSRQGDQAEAWVRYQASHLLVGAVNICAEFLTQRLPAWRDTAVASASYNGAFALSAAAMRVGLAQLGLLRAAAALPRSAQLQASSEELRAMQEAVAEQVRAEGEAALALYRGASGFAARRQGNVHIDAVEEMLGQLDRLTGQVDLADVLAALQAVASREYGSADAMNWLRGHLYSCPNGHLYTIGECGGAMERANCPECGAVIGGGSHQLAGGNAPATEALARLRALPVQGR